MELNIIILLILAVIYVPFYIWVRRSSSAKKRGLVKYGPAVMIKTKWGTKLMDRLSVYRRFWKFFGAFSILISFGLMAFIILIIAVGLLNLSFTLSAPGLGIEYALAIPGLNPLLPFWYAILGLIVAMVIHELAHGFQTRANNMRVDSTGALLFVVPLGAFVEPNEEDIKKSSRRAKLDLYSAGITMNFIGAVVAFFVFAIVMLGGISSAYGDNAAVYRVTADSPASFAEIPSGAIIETVNDMPYFYTDDFTVPYSWNPGDVVTISYITENGPDTVDIRWGLFIDRISPNSPAENYNLVERSFLLSIDGQKIYGYSEFLSFMKTTTPHSNVTVQYMTIGEGGVPSTYTIDMTLGNNGGIGYFGITTSTSGMNFITPNIMLDRGRNPVYGAESITDAASSMLSYIAGPLNGFSPIPASVHWWYDVPLGGAFWILISVFYWIFWLNIMLGVSNAIPAFPFDGGFIFQGGLNSVLERLGMKDEKKREERASRITGVISMVMIFLLVLVILAAVM